jgi:catechol 2,3-dioxygenase-like lactoylglutathione lyase family enzyme
MASLGGIILFVRDVDTLKRFYVHHFGFEATEGIPGEWALLRAGHGELGLHRMGDAHVPTDGSLAGQGSNAKLVFDVDTELEGLRLRLLSDGISVQEPKTWNGHPYWLCDGEDPEGNVFQLRQRK